QQNHNNDNKANTFGTQAYIPPDDFEFNESFQHPTTASTTTTTANASNNNNNNNNFEGGVLSLNHYRRYFNITSSQFTGNIFSSLNPLYKSTEDDQVDDIGDLYGPIWVTATVIFVLFFSNTSANELKNWLSGAQDRYKYDFALFTGAIGLLYGYVGLIPVLLYAVSVFYFKLPNFLNLTKLMAIYGYANFVWVPAAVLAMFRGFFGSSLLSGIILWASVLIGGFISGVGVIARVYPVLKRSAIAVGNEKLSMGLLIALVIAHVGFTIGVRSILVL
ncbi:hypothetical protein WICPIJ_003042, partial [Wickerhamomyces pijperi]